MDSVRGQTLLYNPTSCVCLGETQGDNVRIALATEGHCESNRLVDDGDVEEENL